MVVVSNPKKNRSGCINCGKEQARSYYKYCSNNCQLEYQHKAYILNWKSGKITGLSSIGLVSRYIKNYLRDKYGNKCCICGWAEINLITKQVPLVADHIDGNRRNNTEDNLRLICPNCDSLSSTYAGLNKGNGRSNRRLSKRVIDARLEFKT